MRHRHGGAASISHRNAAFLSDAIPAAQQSERETGVPASITLAQACLESGWGQHHIGIGNNYFGIKAPVIHGQRRLGDVAIGYVMASTHEYDSRHRLITIDDAFRRYASMTDSFGDHGIWIRNNSHYPARSRPTRRAAMRMHSRGRCSAAAMPGGITWSTPTR